MVFLGLPMMTVSSMFVPAMKSVLSKLIAEDEVGKIFGLAAFGETISGLLGAGMFTAVYGASVHLWKGVAFILEAVVSVSVFIVLLWMSGNFAKHYKTLLTNDIGEVKPPITVQVNNSEDIQYTESNEIPDQPNISHDDTVSGDQHGVQPREIVPALNSSSQNYNQFEDGACDTEDRPQFQGAYAY